MKTASALALLACALFMGAALSAQQISDEYRGWMKTCGTTVADLNKNLMAKNESAAIADLDTLQENMSKVMIFWNLKHAPDGMKFASDAREGFSNVAVLVKQGKFDEAAAAAKTAQANCAGCHMAHREKQADGSYQIKLN